VIGTDGARAEWNFPAEADAVRTARHAVRETLRSWEIDAAVGDIAVLLVSELVTNSLRYASGPIGVRLVRAEGAATDPALRAPGGGLRSASGSAHRAARGTRRRRGPRARSRGLFRTPLGDPPGQHRENRMVRAGSPW